MPEFEQALAQYRQLVVDMDGDGIPDAPLQQPMQRPEGFRERLERDPRGKINQPELRSYTPTPGDRVRQATGSPFAGQATNAMLTYGPIPAQEFVNQPFRAGNAINEAVQDPTLANVTNAGVQTAMTVGRPAAAMKMLGAGYGVAGARDLGLDPFDSATAQEPPATAEQPSAPDEMTQILTRQQGLLQERDVAKSRMDVEGRTGQGPRYQAAKSEFDRLNAQVLALDERINQLREANSPEAAERQRAIQRAETMRDEELGRQRRFQDTETGKVYDATGGLTVPLAGMLGGAVTRLGMDIYPGTINRLAREAAPIAGGAGAGVGAMLVPTYYEAQSAPAENPERRAYMGYSRELPPGHPRKQEAMDYAQSLPERNPTQRIAEERLHNDWGSMAVKGAAEGALGGHLGSALVGTGERAVNAMFGRSGPTPPSPTSGTTSNRMLQGMGQASQYRPPASAPPQPPPHPSNYQPRNNGKFAGPPQYPKGHPLNP